MLKICFILPGCALLPRISSLDWAQRLWTTISTTVALRCFSTTIWTTTDDSGRLSGLQPTTIWTTIDDSGLYDSLCVNSYDYLDYNRRLWTTIWTTVDDSGLDDSFCVNSDDYLNYNRRLFLCELGWLSGLQPTTLDDYLDYNRWPWTTIWTTMDGSGLDDSFCVNSDDYLDYNRRFWTTVWTTIVAPPLTSL